MIGKDNKHRADKARKILVQEYFTSALRVPEIEGYLHLKDGYKNKWKKIYVILRASGIYHTLKGKAKVSPTPTYKPRPLIDHAHPDR